MPISQYTNIITQAGLSDSEAMIYELLLAKSGQKASSIAKNSPFKRALVYCILSDLVEQKLIRRIESPGKVAIFSAEHPDRLRTLADERAKNAEIARSDIASLLPKLASTYNLSIGKPGVRFFEGLDGFKQALEDSLYSTEPIFTYADLDAMPPATRAINANYAEKRKNLKIGKKLLLLDTPYARAVMKKQNESADDFRFLPNDMRPFNTSLQIYSGKIAYYTLRDNNMISVIIEDPDIHATHRYLFDMIWKLIAKNNAPPKGAYDMTGLDKFSHSKKDGS